MAHEVTETWEIDGKWHVKPSVGKDKGKTLKVFDSEKEANNWASKRSREYGMDEKKKRRDTIINRRPEQRAKRAELNRYNRKKGTYGNGDGLDASHKGGKIKGFETEKKNRGRREKSRKKGFLQQQGIY